MPYKVCIYGAGAIGGWIGARLAGAGCAVSAVARGETLAALQTRGLLLSEGDAPAEQFAVRAAADPEALGVQDLVVIAVKAPALAGVARRLAPLLGSDTVVLTAMNGVPWWFLKGLSPPMGTQQRLRSVDADGSIAEAIPASRVVGCVVHGSCSLDGPGHVRHHLGQRLVIGEALGGDSQRVEVLAALLRRAGFTVDVSARIQKDVWFKLWGNMTMNPVSALTGATVDRVLDDELVRGFISGVMLEAREIGARLGLPIDESPEDRHAVTRKIGAVKTSMLQDVEAGRPVELDALVAAVRELGAMTHVPTPLTDALFGLARLQARVRGLY